MGKLMPAWMRQQKRWKPIRSNLKGVKVDQYVVNSIHTYKWLSYVQRRGGLGSLHLLLIRSVVRLEVENLDLNLLCIS